MMRLGLGLGLTRGGVNPLLRYAANGFEPDMVLAPRDNFYWTSAAQTTFAGITGGTFLRSTTATFTAAGGLLDTAAIDEARVDQHIDGQLVGMLDEDGATNLLARTEEFDNSYWTKIGVTVTPNAIAAPDGSITADLLTADVSTASHYIRRSGDTPPNPGTGSIFVKRANTDFVFISVGGSTNYRVLFNLATGLFEGDSGTSSFGVEVMGNGWFRIFLSGIVTPANTLGAHPFNSSTMPAAIEDPWTSTGEAVYIWGANLKASPTVSSYIPNPGSGTVARAADDLRIPAAVMQAAILTATGSSAMPAAISIAVKGRMTYADENSFATTTPVSWAADGGNRIGYDLSTDGASTGQMIFIQRGLAVSSFSSTSPTDKAPANDVPFSYAGRHTASVNRGASDGTLAGSSSTVSMPDLTAADFEIATVGNFIIEEVLIWFVDIGDTGITEASQL